jgi:hypothetical protein
MIMLTYKEVTLSEFINNYKMEDITYDTLNFKEILENANAKIKVNSASILDKYLPIFEEFKIVVTLDEAQFRMYQYNPKLLSYDLYGTTEYWSLILQANEMRSATEFSTTKLFVYDKKILSTVVPEIMNIEKPFIDTNLAGIKNR